MNYGAHDFGQNGTHEGTPGLSRKRKRKSRWGEESADKTVIPGLPTVLPKGLEKDQEELYLIQLQIEEISRRLRTGDLGIPPNPEDRSPSPEPIYNNEGKRLNTREYRTRKKLEEQRHELIQKCCNLNTEYKPPSDYKPPVVKVTDKVMIPQEEHPDINFVGLLIGPRGNTLKNLEKETGAKIIIRGKGSVKEGKIGRKDGQPLPGEDEPLHAYITANNPDHVKKAAEKINEIIKQGIEVPEQQNNLRRQQLRELALLNGTLRENDGLAKLKQIQQAQTIITNTIVCSKCGGTGHLSQDCKQARPSDSLRNISDPTRPVQGVDKAKMDSEYSALMAELGEGPPPSSNNAAVAPPISRHAPITSGFGTRPQFTSPPPGVPPPSQMQQPPPFNTSQPPPQSRPPGPPLQQPPPNFQPPPVSGPPPNMPPPPQQHIPGAPPPFSMSQPTFSMSQPPPMSSQAPPPASSAPPSSTALPWQHPPSVASSAPPGIQPPVMSTAASNMGGPPPNFMSAPPPPPPPSSQGVPPPWQQQPPPHQPPQNYGMPPPPGPPGGPAPWQQHPSGPPPMGPPPPGPPGGNIPPWHHPHGGPPPAAPMGGPPPPHMMPPPPPPGSNYSAAAPPPPPPGREGGIPAGIPLGVPPPPPPS